jgi:hypothetical protein
MSKREIQEFAIMVVPIIDYLKMKDEFEGSFEEFLEEYFTPEFVRDFHENKAILEQLIVEFYDEKGNT